MELLSSLPTIQPPQRPPTAAILKSPSSPSSMRPSSASITSHFLGIEAARVGDAAGAGGATSAGGVDPAQADIEAASRMAAPPELDRWVDVRKTRRFLPTGG